jgi:hypothetical protein
MDHPMALIRKRDIEKLKRYSIRGDQYDIYTTFGVWIYKNGGPKYPHT